MQRGTLELLRFANFNLDICTYKQQQQKSQKISLSTLWYIVITHEIILPATLLQVYNTYNSSIYATMVIVSPTKEIPSPIYVIYVKAFWCFSGSWKGRQEEKKDIKFASKIISEHRNPFYFIGLAF